MEGFQECFSSFSSSSSLSNQHQLCNDEDCWLIADRIIEEILFVIQPTVVSEQRRMEVIHYIQRLIKGYFGTEIFAFGSVPLKTYLPDGDIDLTAVSHQNVEEDLARDICSILEGEEQNNAEFLVKDVQYIPAQVKIVKCTVQNIAVDISFNQMTGLCSLCFLEQVDQFIGRNHLFKRSIILTKAWCYYESRILGAHHGLISTYALETLVLHIINLFHSSLPGPLAVLYRFLDYYSTFNWEKYCIGLNGPVAINSLPEVVVEPPENDGSDLLLSKEFLESCIEYFSVPMKVFETKGQTFPIKHLNIMDPLKDNNNLGRSVSKANFYRIRLAFSYGASKFKEILMRPGESMCEDIKRFFVNTLVWNGRGQGPDVVVPVPVLGGESSEVSDLNGDYDSLFKGLLYGQWYHNYILPVPIQSSPWTFPSLFQNKSSPVQINQKVFSLRNTNEFSNTAFGVEDITNFRGAGSYISDIGVEEKMNSQGTDMLIPDMCVEEKLKLQGMGTCIPDVGHEENFELRGTCTWIPAMSMKEMEKIRNYFPDMAQCSYRQMYVWERGRNPEPQAQGSLLKTSLNIEQLGVCSKADKDASSRCFELSLEEFPLLPSRKKAVPSESLQPVQPTVASSQARESSYHTEGIDFGLGASRHSQAPSIESSTVASKQPDSGGSTTMGNEEMFLFQSFQLNDDKDFPPLCYE